MTIRTRFAPSPTGYLHIGGVRTALFNWLFTRRHGGQFILRIDDTDTERNRPEALQPILEGFKWLGIHWDEGPEVGGPNGPYYQSQRGDRYREVAFDLMEKGHVYPCYATKEELATQRKQAEANKTNFIYRGVHRNTDPAECRRLYAEQPTVLRLKVPTGKTIAIEDMIRGRVEWQSDLIGDPVILRADGRPIYNFATVVDDLEMEITHIIRASEHLTNTSIQLLVYEALKAPLPKFGHVPVVNEPNSSKKLSKRTMGKFVTAEVRAKLQLVGWSEEEINSRDDLNPATVAYYQELGYLPSGLVNYLARLGWSVDDKTEIMTLEEMISQFDLNRVNSSPASFDPDKLLWMAAEHMKKKSLEEKVHGVIPFLHKVGLIHEHINAETDKKIRQIVESAGERLRIFSDILLHAPMFLVHEPVYDDKAVEKKLKKEGAANLLEGFKTPLNQADPFDPPHLEQVLNNYCDERGAKKNLLIHALRVATTGQEVGLGLYESLVILGREECLRRIDLALKLARS